MIKHEEVGRRARRTQRSQGLPKLVMNKGVAAGYAFKDCSPNAIMVGVTGVQQERTHQRG